MPLYNPLLSDSKALVTNRIFRGSLVAPGNTFILITDTGNLKYATVGDPTGVPINDGADAGQYDASYVEIVGSTTGVELVVTSGVDAGKLIVGRTRAGSTGVSPNSVEIEFRAVAIGSDLSTSVPYTWEASQPLLLDFMYGYRELLPDMRDAALRIKLSQSLAATTGSGLTQPQVLARLSLRV